VVQLFANIKPTLWLCGILVMFLPMGPSEEKTLAEFDAYAADYDAALNQGLRLTGESKEYYAEGRVGHIRARMALLGLKAGNCLDFGCGTGTSAVFLRDGLGIGSYTGYDPSQDSITEAKRAVPWSEANFLAETDAVPRQHFDLAFTNGVFHHIPPDQRGAALRLVFGSLKPGGVFAFWENNRWNPAVHWVMSRVPFDRDAQMLFPHQARRLLRQAGLKVLRTDHLFFFPARLAALRPLERWLRRLPLGGQYLVLAQKPLA
jgi:SAM-dependent methyltransferase